MWLEVAGRARMLFRLKQKLGAIGYDLPRFAWCLPRDWVRIRNRSETLDMAPDGTGAQCRWKWTSELHIAKVFASMGRRLLQRALHDWPIRLAEAQVDTGGEVQVSFVIGHRGLVRLPHLLATLGSIAAQKGAACECIVVEQSAIPEIQSSLPSWVRYVHTPLPQSDVPYCRSWTLNVGARLARGALLVFHDNDMLVPECYAAELWRRFKEGYEVINAKRFVFYLEEVETKRFFETAVLPPDASSEAVVQNLEAGGSVAMAKDAFFAIGGYDESFVGWGGEDNEFWERAHTRKLWSFGYLPIVHLWHTAQPRKTDPDNPTLRHYARLSSTAIEDRIAELNKRSFGQTERLSVDWPSPQAH